MRTDPRAADAVIADLARRQHGVMHLHQLLDRNVSRRQVEGRLASGRLIDLGHRVYAVPSAPATPLRQYKAAELAVDGAALCSLAAANLHGLSATRSAAPEIAVRPGSNHRCSFALVHRRSDITTTTVKGIRVTTVPQTLVDITGRLRLPDLEECWTSALIHRRATLDELAEQVVRAERQRLRHRGLARSVLDSLVEGAGLADSELEVLLLDLVATVVDLPPTVPQLPLPFWAQGRGRADVGIPAWKLLLEVDGRSWHARLRDFERDRDRDNVAVANGYAVLRFSALQLRHDPTRVVELILQAGARRSAA